MSPFAQVFSINGLKIPLWAPTIKMDGPHVLHMLLSSFTGRKLMSSQIGKYQSNNQEWSHLGLHHNFNSQQNKRKQIEFTAFLIIVLMACFFTGYYFL